MRYSELPVQLKKQLSQLETPFLFYDLYKIRENYKLFIKHIAPDSVFYAVKACSLAPVLKTLKKAGCSFEVNTKIEFQKAIAAGAQPNKIINSSPVKRSSDIEYMYKRGVTSYVYDSFEELEKISAFAPNSGVVIRVYISNDGSGQKLNTKFGVDSTHATALIKKAKTLGLNPYGVTFHVGSQCENLANWEEGLKKTAKLFNECSSLTTINLGGGFPVQYSGTKIPPFEKIAKTINSALTHHFKRRPLLHAEPGRAIVGDAAFSATTIVGKKKNVSKKWYFIDLSIFGGFIELFEFKEDFAYEVESERKQNNSAVRLQNYDIAGPTCDGTDIIARNIKLPALAVGDRLYFLNTGAYTLEYASDFNGFLKPTVYYLTERGNITVG